MKKISRSKDKVEQKLFHNVTLDVYPTTLSLDKIEFWKENNRTIFTFERLCREKGKKNISEFTIEEITQFVADQDVHKIEILAKSISRNGVQVPLIIRDDGKLLDGNRRYFACQWLKMQCEKRNESLPVALTEIPVQVILKTDIDKESNLERKILAEANFIPDLKIPWSLDAQSRAVYDYYEQLRKNKEVDHDAAVLDIVSVFGIKAQRVNKLMETLKLTKEFIERGKTEEGKMQFRGIVEGKFVYFWEFLNKSMKGRGEYKDPKELKEVKDVFFSFMAKGTDNPITNVKQVEPLVQAKRTPMLWKILKEPGRAKVNLVVSAMNEKKEVRKAEDKIRLFIEWLKDAKDLTSKAKEYLRELIKSATKKL